MTTIDRADEVLRGISVNWIGYTPPGGEKWQNCFNTEIKPVIKQLRESSIAFKSKLLVEHQAFLEILSFVNDIQSKGASIVAGERLKKNENAKTIYSHLSDIVQKAKEIVPLLTPEIIESLQKDIDAEVRYFDELNNYIEADKELDRLLYALMTVPLKYKSKILRACYRLLNVVETSREYMKTHPLNKRIETLDKLFQTQDPVYERIAPYIRKLKRQVDKRGIEALDI